MRSNKLIGRALAACTTYVGRSGRVSTHRPRPARLSNHWLGASRSTAPSQYRASSDDRRRAIFTNGAQRYQRARPPWHEHRELR